MTKIVNLIDFMRFTHRIQQVKRRAYAVGEDRRETDAEHMFQLGLVAWYIIESNGLKLDKGRVLMLALVHDLLEVYAGDTPAYSPDYNSQAKADRERAGIEQLIADWPEFHTLRDTVEEYEATETPEAKFVYSLDKLLPIINNLTDGGRAWHEQDVTMDRLKQVKAGKIDRDPAIAGYYEQILPILESHPEIFSKRSS